MGKVSKKAKDNLKVVGIEQFGNFKRGWIVHYKVGSNKYEPDHKMHVDEFLQWRPDFTRHIENLKKGAPPYVEPPRTKDLFQICQEMTEEYYGKIE